MGTGRAGCGGDGSLARSFTRLDGYRSRCMFHCHNIEHEGMGMMANFDVI
ncbi:hypothetical protein E1193_28005 [Micromonospora sp. KC606]|nr:multicopper oxidase domain-containing protein [Micromonospora sp. KC606]TDC72322.1 hypothetical protein E1193_28005 [Micromonospora sp. KC606]